MNETDKKYKVLTAEDGGVAMMGTKVLAEGEEIHPDVWAEALNGTNVTYCSDPDENEWFIHPLKVWLAARRTDEGSD